MAYIMADHYGAIKWLCKNQSKNKDQTKENGKKIEKHFHVDCESTWIVFDLYVIWERMLWPLAQQKIGVDLVLIHLIRHLYELPPAARTISDFHFIKMPISGLIPIDHQITITETVTWFCTRRARQSKSQQFSIRQNQLLAQNNTFPSWENVEKWSQR